MSRRHIRDHGTHCFGTFPNLRWEPLPDPDLHSYALSATRDGGDLGTRMRGGPAKLYVCANTGRRYGFWDNYVRHTRLLDRHPRLDFNEHSDAHDGWRFSYRDNLRLHDHVLALERGQGRRRERARR